MKRKILTIFFLSLTVFIGSLLFPEKASSQVLGKPEPGMHPSCTTSDTPQHRQTMEILGLDCTKPNKCFFGYDCKNAEDCKTAPNNQCQLCFFCETWNYGVDPLTRYSENLKSEEMNVDQWLGGRMTEEGEMKTSGTVDSLVLKALSLGIGLPDKNGNLSGGIMGIETGMIASVYSNPPASGIIYVADLLQNAGFVKSAYAQGVGFTSLAPILTIWKVFRNFAYLIITVLFVILGVMIMFRIKLSPQTVISIQNAIPKIIVTLILITFSYAIAGLLIDLSNLILVLVIRVLGAADLLPADITISSWLNADIAKVIGSTIGTLLSAVKYLFLSGPLGVAVGTIGAVGGGLGIAAIVSAIITGLASATATLPAGVVILAAFAPAAIALLAGIVFAIIGLIFRIFIVLVRAYVAVILGVVLGPLQIIFDALPGQKSSAFNSWIKNLLANILVFPTIALLFILSVVFEKVIIGSTETLWSPPTLTANKELVVLFIKIGILMIIPSVPDFINSALAIKTPLGAAIGKSPLEKPARFWKQGIKATSADISEELKRTRLTPEAAGRATRVWGGVRTILGGGS